MVAACACGGAAPRRPAARPPASCLSHWRDSVLFLGVSCPVPPLSWQLAAVIERANAAGGCSPSGPRILSALLLCLGRARSPMLRGGVWRISYLAPGREGRRGLCLGPRACPTHIAGGCAWARVRNYNPTRARHMFPRLRVRPSLAGLLVGWLAAPPFEGPAHGTAQLAPTIQAAWRLAPPGALLGPGPSWRAPGAAPERLRTGRGLPRASLARGLPPAMSGG